MPREKRKAQRQHLRYGAWVALPAAGTSACMVSDISETGARLAVQDSNATPDHFVLMLSRNGAARRYCAVMWRRSNEVGVRFFRNLAEAKAAALAPKPTVGAAPDVVPDDFIVEEPARTGT